jgi:hypothetical protein
MDKQNLLSLIQSELSTNQKKPQEEFLILKKNLAKHESDAY